MTVTGVIEAIGPPLRAPLSGQACVGYRAHARVLDGPHGISVIGEPTEVRAIRFRLVTAKGTLVVDTNAALEVRAQPLVPRQPAREAAFLADHGFPERSPTDGAFDEVALVVGGRVTVTGMLVRERLPPEHGGYRDAGDERVLITSTAQPLTVRDPAW